MIKMIFFGMIAGLIILDSLGQNASVIEDFKPSSMITLNKSDVFSYYGLLSGGIYAPEDVKNHFNLKLIFISCGSSENPDRFRQAVQELQEKDINAFNYVSDNTGHEFLTWRRSLYKLAPLLFQ